MNPILARFSTEQKAFHRLQKLCESKVVRWEYWRWPAWHWEPDFFLDARHKAKPVTKDKAWYGYGHDKDDRVVVINRFDMTDPDKLDGVDYLRYSGSKIIGSHFIPDAVYGDGKMVIRTDWAAGSALAEVFEATLSGGRIVRVEHLMGQGWEWKTIEWEGEKVVKAVLGTRGRKPHREIIYDKTGKVVDDIDLSEPVKRKPLPKGVTMNSLAKEIRKRLTDVIVQTVTKAKIKEPVYCLALNYDCEGNPLLLPELGIGLESNRRALLKRGGRDAKLDIWDAANFPMFGSSRTALMGRDKKLDHACDLYNRELEYKGSDEPARKLILQVAADLAKVNWKGKLNPTDDFIVYAVDTDGADLRKNMKLCVSAKQLAKLKSAKLI